MVKATISQLYEELRQGKRRALAKALTLVESKNPADKETANALFTLIPASTTMKTIAISGPPGAGKSTFIDAFGCFLINQGLKVAVLAVDPSSPLSGGALLADKTRMERLSLEENAFIRPAPTGQGRMGGITAATQDCLSLFSAAGYDYTLLETVGVGQNEVDAKALCDAFCLILPPASGDDLQGLKKGIVELVDLFIINKHDGTLKEAARLTADSYQAALKDSQKTIPVILCSALENQGFHNIYEALLTLKSSDKNLWPWVEKQLKEEIAHLLINHPKIIPLTQILRQQVAQDHNFSRLQLNQAIIQIRTLLNL